MNPRIRLKAEDKESFPPVRTLKLGGNLFQLGHQISRGAFSIVYGGVDMWGNAIAMKLMAPEADKRLWEREARALGRFRHPCVPHLYAAGEHEGRLYLALERCGISVSRMQPAAELRPLACQMVARSLLQVLHSLHRQGHVHGDVCPNNVLIRDPSPQAPGAVKLADFALCVPVEELASRHIASPWQPLPERLEPGRNGSLGTASDVYLASLVLLQVLTGNTHHYTDAETLAGLPRDHALALGTPLGDAIALGLALETKTRPGAAALWMKLPKPVRPAA